MSPTEAESKRSHKKKPRSTGVGESRPFVAEPGAFPESAIDYSALTLNGQPIPEELWATLPYKYTDQGAADLNAGKEQVHAQVLRDERLSSRTDRELLNTTRERTIEQSVAQFAESLNMTEHEDVHGVLMKRYLPEGMRGLWMSERKCSNEGMRRGVLDYAPVMVQQDGKLEKIKSGNMFLAMVPEEKAKAADAFYAEKAKRDTIEATERVKTSRDQVLSEVGVQRQNRRGGESVDGFEIEDAGPQQMFARQF